MIKRRFGRTGHISTIAVFGAAAFYESDQETADKTMQLVIESGINHIDIAPGYGKAEQLISPWIEAERQRFFLGCKTMERSKEAAEADLYRSLEIMKVDRFDLYQLHAVTNEQELDQATGSGGALEAIIEARELGLTDYVGITSHGNNSPELLIDALQRFDFDSVIFPINFVQFADPNYKQKSEALLQICQQRDVGIMIIKSVAKGPWSDKNKIYNTWYEPFDDFITIQKCVNFALSQNVTALCTPGDVNILPNFLKACKYFKMMDVVHQQELIQSADMYASIFV